MLRVSTKSTYGLRALIHMVRQANGKPQNLARIAEQQNIPLPYLEQIFSKLKKASLVKAIRGPQGGFELTRSPDEITLVDIISALEGPIKPVLCSYPENASSECRNTGECLTRSICHELDGSLHHVLSNKTLGMLCEEAQSTIQ